MAFDIVISLGYRCFTATNLRRMMLHAHTMPFDWIISTPSGAARAISSKFEGALDPSKLRLIDSPEGLPDSGILDAKYDFEHYHEFDDVRDHMASIETVRARRALLETRFLGAASSKQRILFVRHETPGHGSLDHVEMLETEISKLTKSFALLYMSDALPTSCSTGRYIFNTPQHTDLPSEVWDHAFRWVNDKERIRGYFPSLIEASSRWPKSLREKTSKFIGSTRKRIFTARVFLTRESALKRS